jgi:hypothetical protein
MRRVNLAFFISFFVRTPAPPWITSTTLVHFDGDKVVAAESPCSVANNEVGTRHDVAIDAADALRKIRRDDLLATQTGTAFNKLADDKPLHGLNR